ncbi:Dopamine beta-hydroxylase [Hypsibius exemplaris]|uniref:Dopamine beta-hydroxylase n=1 Tax=Hypsibius exemplaris TaxID=2072580 RepID=A0A1W0WBR1_HYPEX|nr:Dopamine beta-hydroxylase [Hypsibius exemplaris]
MAFKKILFIFIILISSCVDCLKVRPFHVDVEKRQRLTLSWDYDPDNVYFEVRAKVSPRAWLAVGFSDYGEYSNGDFCVFWTDSWGRRHFTDVYSDAMGAQLHVDQQQDCELTSVNQTASETVIQFSRKRSTCDERDYQLEEGTTHTLFVVGPGPLSGVEGQSLDGKNLYKNMVRLSLFPPHSGLEEPDVTQQRHVKTMEVLSEKVKVPARETTYWCVIRKLPDLEEKNHIIQYEAAIQEGNEDLVHHIEVFHCLAPAGVRLYKWEGDCDADGAPEQINHCKRVIGAWAMGSPPLTYPEEAGYPLGGKDFSPYIRIEMHYNNPAVTAGRVDSSGIRFYYTTQLRRYDAGCLELGLEYSPKMAIPPRMAKFELSGHCTAGCTSVGFPPRGIMVFASQLHTHLTGARVWTRHFRNGIELPELDRDNHYSTMYQEIRKLKRRVNILPGDELLTTCEFRTLDRKNATLGGYAISDEMCVNYIHYYPRTNLEVCKSSIDTDSLMTYFEAMHTTDLDETAPDKSVIDNYHSIRWTPITAAILRSLYQESPLSMQCNMSSGARFPGNWNNNPQVLITKPLPPKRDPCMLQGDDPEQ